MLQKLCNDERQAPTKSNNIFTPEAREMQPSVLVRAVSMTLYTGRITDA